MLSISQFNFQDLLFENSKIIKPIEIKNGKKYEVSEITVRINGKNVKLKFRRDLETNKIIPQKPKKTKGKLKDAKV